MISNHTNASHILLYDDRETNEADWKEWAEENCYGNMTSMSYLTMKDTFIKFEKVVGGYFNCTFGTLGLIGNVLSILVLCRKEMRKNCFSQLLIGLVTCDSLHIIFGIMDAIRTSWEDLYHDNLMYIFPWFHYPFYRITLVSSIYMMIAVAIERFFAVCFPHNYHNLNAQRNRALYYIVPAIAAAFLVQIPRFFETKFVPSRTIQHDNETHLIRAHVGATELRLDPTYIVIMHWLRTMFDGILPFITLLFLNGKIFIGLKKVKNKIELHAKANGQTKVVNGTKGGDQGIKRNGGGSVCSRRKEPVNTDTEICRDDRSMVTTGNKCVSPSQENTEMVNLVSSNPGLDTAPSKQYMKRSHSVKFCANECQPNITGMGSTNSLANPISKDKSRITIGFEDNKVVFLKNSTTEDNKESPDSIIKNGSPEMKQHEIPSDQLLSVNMNNGNNNTTSSARGSISTLDGNMETTRTYLHAPSLVSGETENTGMSIDNAENGPPIRQRDSSGSIRAAVARRKQNMTHRSAAQKREANLAVVLVSSVTMFLICHAPRIFANLYEGCRMSDDNPILKCSELGLLGIPRWFLYITPLVKFLQIFNAAINFPIYYFMGTSFRDTFHAMIKVKGHSFAHNGNGVVTGVR